MRRKIMNRKSNKRSFRRGAKMHPKNARRSVSRGGICL